MDEKNKMLKLAGTGTNYSINEGKQNSSILEAIEIIDKYDYLQKALKFIIINSESNNSPYHDLNHLLTVLKYCYQGIEGEKISNKKEVTQLLLSAIFHDVNHTAGKEKDDVNIKNSKKIMKKFIESEKIDVNLDAMNDILDATQYPYEIDGSDLNICQSIIRDADLMQVFEYNWIQQNIGGLSNELNLKFIDFLTPQRKFLENAEFNTSWGKKLKKEKWDNVMRQFKMLEDACSIKLKSDK